MQNVLPRTKPILPNIADVQPAGEIEGVIRDFVGRNAKNAGSTDTSEIATNADTLVKRTTVVQADHTAKLEGQSQTTRLQPGSPRPSLSNSSQRRNLVIPTW